MRRIERLINLIAALLETSHPLTAEDIRDQIAGYDQATPEAFRRAFERDKEALRALGIPLELRPTDPFREHADGYIIPKDAYYLPELDLEPDELAALTIASRIVLDARESAGAGLMKLSMTDEASPLLPGRLSWGADVAAEQPVISPLYSAILDRVPVGFAYEAANGQTTNRTVHPYALTHTRGNWYLVALDTEKEEPRTFKASRIKSSITRLQGTYQIPKDFDVGDHVSREPWQAGEEPVEAEIRFDANMRWWAEQNLGIHESTDGSEGSLVVKLPVSNPDAFISWLIEFDTRVELISPSHLREALCRHLAPVLASNAPSSVKAP